MEFELAYKNKEQVLVDDFIDVGYMAENVEVISTCKKVQELKRSRGDNSMTLFVSYPSSEDFIDEIIKLDEFMSDIKVDIECYLLFSKDVKLETKLKKFQIFFDDYDEFGNMYGTKIIEGTLQNRLTKALFLISKDGAVFYLDMPINIENHLDLNRLHIELNRAYITYTGVGCHG